MGAGGSVLVDALNVTSVRNLRGYDTGTQLEFDCEVVNVSPYLKVIKNNNNNNNNLKIGEKTFDHVKKRPHCPFKAEYPLYFVPGHVILDLAFIPTHEQLIEHNAILHTTHSEPFDYSQGVYEEGWGTGGMEYIFTEMLVLPDGNYLSTMHRRVFFSHRWFQRCDVDGTYSATPDDDNNAKLNKMKELITPSDLVWFDYMCIPQSAENRAGQLAAIASLPYYIAMSDVLHILTTDEINLEQYKTRAFTNIELVCANMSLLSGGFDGSVMPSNARAKPLCETFGVDGKRCFPYCNPLHAEMFNRDDLPAIAKLVELVVSKLEETIESCLTKNCTHYAADAKRLLEFLKLPPADQAPSGAT
eukprot:gene29384-35469_t